jgi:hypothetical protein
LRDPVLRAFSDMPARFRESYALLLVTDGQWSAVNDSDGRWRVEARIADSDPTVFFAYESDGFVVGWIEPPTD